MSLPKAQAPPVHLHEGTIDKTSQWDSKLSCYLRREGS